VLDRYVGDRSADDPAGETAAYGLDFGQLRQRSLPPPPVVDAIGQGVAEAADVGVALPVAAAEVGTAVGVGLVTTVASGGAPSSDCTADGLLPDSGVE
jgi:hypothetical protein